MSPSVVDTLYACERRLHIFKSNSACQKKAIPPTAGAAAEAGAVPKAAEEEPKKLKPPAELPKAGVLAPKGEDPPKPPPAQSICSFYFVAAQQISLRIANPGLTSKGRC